MISFITVILENKIFVSYHYALTGCTTMSMSETARRKPRPRPIPYARKPRQKPTKEQNTDSTRSNLTLHDWMTVFAYIDEHPDTSQADVVQDFATRQTGALHFTQSTLSRKLKERANLGHRVHDNPSALSSKRPADLWMDLTFSDAMQRCEKLEAACWKFGCPDNDLTIPHRFRRFRGYLRSMQTRSTKQMTLDSLGAKK